MTITLNELTQIKIVDSDGHELNVAADGSLVVSATDLDIRALNSTDDKVAVETIKDGSGNSLAINADGSLNIVGSVTTTPESFAAMKSTQQNASTTVSQIAATPLGGRLAINIQNLGGSDIYIGEANTVTAVTGEKIAKNASKYIDLDDNATIWMLTAAGSADVRITEYKA